MRLLENRLKPRQHLLRFMGAAKAQADRRGDHTAGRAPEEEPPHLLRAQAERAQRRAPERGEVEPQPAGAPRPARGPARPAPAPRGGGGRAGAPGGPAATSANSAGKMRSQVESSARP